jgi:chitin synthase
VQILLLFGSVLGPGTILLMLVGAFNTAFKLDMTLSMILNVVPVIIFMIVCYFTKADTQVSIT